MTSALIVVDMINDFCHEDGWLASWGVDVSVLAPVVDAVAASVAHARSAGVPVVWVNWGVSADQSELPEPVRRVFDPAGEGRGFGAVLPNGSRALTTGSWGVELVAPLTVEPGDTVVAKQRMSGFPGTVLDVVLWRESTPTSASTTRSPTRHRSGTRWCWSTGRAARRLRSSATRPRSTTWCGATAR